MELAWCVFALADKKKSGNFTQENRSQQTPNAAPTIHSNARSTVGLVRYKQEIVRILGAEIKALLQRAFFQHDAFRNVRNPRPVDSVAEQDPVRHQTAYTGRDGDKGLLRNKDTQAARVMTRNVPTDAIGELSLRWAVF